MVRISNTKNRDEKLCEEDHPDLKTYKPISRDLRKKIFMFEIKTVINDLKGLKNDSIW